MQGSAGTGRCPSGVGRSMAALGMACAGIAVLAGAAPFAAAAEARPNVLVILTDDMRWDAIGAVQRDEGQRALFPWFETPHLDRLVREGCRFKAAFVTTSLCSPSRASLISGRYAHRHGVRNNFTDYPAALPGYPRRLQEAGYETAYIGKWHMGEDDDAARPGFDFWMSHKGQGAYHDNEFNVDGTRRVIPGYYTTVVTDAALEWLDRPHPAPWLLVVGHKAPHGGPIVPEDRYEHAFDRLPVVEPANAGSYRAADGKPAWLERSFPTWHGLGGPLYGRKEYGAFVRAYLGCIASVDDSVGRIVERLEASGRLDDTIVVFTSDNGFALGEHGRVDKRTAYEESIRVPLVVRYPRRATPSSTTSAPTPSRPGTWPAIRPTRPTASPTRPLLKACRSRSPPDAGSETTAKGPASHSAPISPTPSAAMAGKFAIRGTTSIAVRPSHVAGASSVNAGSGIASRIVTGMSRVFTPPGHTARKRSVAAASPATRPASNVQEKRSTATTSSTPSRITLQAIFRAPPASAVTVALRPSSRSSRSAESARPSPGSTTGPTSDWSGFWFSYSSRAHSGERTTRDTRTSSRSPTKS